MVSQAEDEQKAMDTSVDPVRRVLSCEKSVFYIKLLIRENVQTARCFIKVKILQQLMKMGELL